MSTMLPIAEPSPDFIGNLLRDQQSLSAVERFSQLHDAGRIASGYVVSGGNRYHELLPASPPGPQQQYSFEVDLDQCSGCKACVVACHTLNGLEDDEAWRRVGTVFSADPQCRIQHVTTACHHCEDPGCLSGCPVKAYEKDPHTGIVRHLDDQCIGCKYCTMMCPYEVPRYSERLGIVRKCDMCHQRLSAGEAPACVQACPNEAIAIRVIDRSDATRDAVERLAPGAALSRLTLPTTRYKTAYPQSFAAATAQDEAIDPVAESHWPLAVMLIATQISVGMLIAERIFASCAALSGQPWPIAITRFLVPLSLLIAGVGMALAPLHLGQPLRAWRVFLGLRTSWLSREAVILGKYMGLLTAATALLWIDAFADYLPTQVFQALPDWTVPVTLVGAIALGVAGLYSSAMIYIATRRQLWRHGRTLIRFLGTASVGGLAWLTVVVTAVADDQTHSRVAASILVVAAVAKLLWEYRVQFADRPHADRYDVRSRQLVWGPLKSLAAARFVTGLGGAAVAFVFTFAASASPAAQGLACSAAFASAVLLSAGELCERLLYFSSVVFDRMPGMLR